MRRAWLVSIVCLAASVPLACGGDTPTTVDVGIMMHLEANKLGTAAIFQDYAAQLRTYATLFEKYGARMTLEAHATHLDAIEKFGDNFMTEMEARGHASGVHADSGFPEEDYTQDSFVNDLVVKKAQAERLGLTVRHISGICSALDWVGAAIAAGFSFTTGNVAYCAMSLDKDLQPPEYSDCPSPGACHEQFPRAAPHQPWRPRRAARWLEDDEAGPIVLLPAGWIIDFAHEEADDLGLKLKDGVFDQADIDVAAQTLDEAIAAAVPDRVNHYYFAWSFGKSLDPTLLESWLKMIDERVKAGKLVWKTLPQVYDEYIAWEQAHGRS